MAPATKSKQALPPSESFVARHIGPDAADRREMLAAIGLTSLDVLADTAVPAAIRLGRELSTGPGLSEHETLVQLKGIGSRNQIFRSYIGMGYHDCVTPPVILRGILENPGWYTAYTPYQAEIAQGRLEALVNFQQMVIDLTGLEVANASLLDEATAAAEAMAMSHNLHPQGSKLFFVSQWCHPQTTAVVRTRAEALGLSVEVGDHEKFDFSRKPFGVLVQYPATCGSINDYGALCEKAHQNGALVTAACDLLSLVLLKSPGEFGADIAVGSAQRFGVPMGYGGPHAAFMATKDAYKRLMPGRIVGVSKDSSGKPAYRLALQTREQHIRREKATSNICTAQVLLAVTASMYGVYHGPNGLRRIAERVNALARLLAHGLRRLGYEVADRPFFDTVRVTPPREALRRILSELKVRRINVRLLEESIVVALDETVSEADVRDLLDAFAVSKRLDVSLEELAAELPEALPRTVLRESAVLTHPVFNSFRSETEMLRYMKRLEAKDLSLTHSMIPLGSCTMKLNAAAEMLPITWPEFGRMHPFAPLEQAQGYQELFRQLSRWLCEITGFAAVSLQPNAGSQGEYAGLLAIRAYHKSRGEGARSVCLIPQSAHGTNPASAALAGFKCVVVATSPEGDIDVRDLKIKAEEHSKNLAALMVTYPSTHGVFEEGIKEICAVVHQHGGQVYMDGANMNAQVGLCRPGDIGADVCHLNLHKTFCIPHGGGGPGMGPIGVAEHLAPFLPGHPVVNPSALDPAGPRLEQGPVSAAPWGSASILPISWAYIAMMGSKGLTEATQAAILNANYIAKRLGAHYPVLFKGSSGLVAHECILDCRQFKAACDVQVEDIAKRLMDYGFHAPTVSFPVSGTLMIEPTESESKAELDRFCAAMISIREEIREIEAGKADKANNVLKNSPHTAELVCSDKWDKPYPREKAAYPLAWVRERKFWPAVGRIDNAYGDRNFACSCPPWQG